MSKVEMKALDTMHVSSAGPDNLAAGDTFEVSETDAKSLEDRGLAKRTGKKMAEQPANKMADAPANKAITVTVAAKRAKG